MPTPPVYLRGLFTSKVSFDSEFAQLTRFLPAPFVAVFKVPHCALTGVGSTAILTNHRSIWILYDIRDYF